jgi:site-specific DNA-methyltransferase (adenine-specific)
VSDLLGTVHHCSHLDLAARLTAAGQRVDLLATDCPYSDRCHSGQPDEGLSRALDYSAWTADDVRAFVSAWAPLVDGWIVSITDEDLRGPWRDALHDAGLLTFARVPAIETGATVRFQGDGPANWTTDVVVARSRAARHCGAWGRASPYYLGPREVKSVQGGKPLWLMRALVRDYSRPGDLVCDPCAGAGTTLVAAKMSGRRWIGGDCDAAHVEIARKRLEETTPCDSRGTPIGGAKGRSEALAWGDDYAALAARKAGA